MSRKKGKHYLMEKELYKLFRERRAHGRKVSARWLSATARSLMTQLHPGAASTFCGSKSWRRRFAQRFRIGVRRKTNVKCSTWEETEPVLQNYFRGLRKRLQLPEPQPYASHEEISDANPITCTPDTTPTDEQIDTALYSTPEVLERLAVTPESLARVWL